jgi:hypothetical protein
LLQQLQQINVLDQKNNSIDPLVAALKQVVE